MHVLTILEEKLGLKFLLKIGALRTKNSEKREKYFFSIRVIKRLFVCSLSTHIRKKVYFQTFVPCIIFTKTGLEKA